MIADVFTVSRMLFSLCMLFLPINSYLFGIGYILCGVTDILDGYAARKLHTESDRGARLDSLADLCFAVNYAVKIVPNLQLPLWSYVWIGLITGIKIIGIILKSNSTRRLCIEHSFSNRLTGILVFLMPLTVRIVSVKYTAGIVCTAATVSAVDELIQKTT